jgi:hypothetical protein
MKKVWNAPEDLLGATVAVFFEKVDPGRDLVRLGVERRVRSVGGFGAASRRRHSDARTAVLDKICIFAPYNERYYVQEDAGEGVDIRHLGCGKRKILESIGVYDSRWREEWRAYAAVRRNG